MTRKRLNSPPESGIRLPSTQMEQLVSSLFLKAGTSREDADLMGEILTGNDLRCIFSHGTRQTSGYVRKMLCGDVNPRPDVKATSESPGALVMDGDGGLGYFPCHHGTNMAIDKAKTCGIAALTTRNHFHFGAAANYCRQALVHDCIGLSLSSSRWRAGPERVVAQTVGSSPVSVAIPAGEHPPLIMDMSSNAAGYSEELFAKMPVAVLKSMALAAVVHSLGGHFAGIYRDEFERPKSQWESNQGAFIIVLDVSHFMPVEELKQHMDSFISDSRRAQPLPGFERAELAGGMEWLWEKENRAAGIPVSDDHRQGLQEIADEMGVDTPFSQYENSRFESGSGNSAE